MGPRTTAPFASPRRQACIIQGWANTGPQAGSGPPELALGVGPHSAIFTTCASAGTGDGSSRCPWITIPSQWELRSPVPAEVQGKYSDSHPPGPNPDELPPFCCPPLV